VYVCSRVGRNNYNLYITLDMELVNEEFEGDIGDYALSIVMEARVVAVDNGIGDYEFWGTRGYHTDIVKELESAPYIEEMTLIDEDSNQIEIGEEEKNLIDKWITQNSSRIEETLLEKAIIDC
tara:strand:+ start:2150 stop:2518 length:369 start_codon:yes stop_codon:yes gene_type:complete